MKKLKDYDGYKISKADWGYYVCISSTKANKMLSYAYDGVRLCKQVNGSSGMSDLSCRFFYDQDEYETSNYDAFKDMLNTLINTLQAYRGL